MSVVVVISQPFYTTPICIGSLLGLSTRGSPLNTEEQLEQGEWSPQNLRMMMTATNTHRSLWCMEVIWNKVQYSNFFQ